MSKKKQGNSKPKKETEELKLDKSKPAETETRIPVKTEKPSKSSGQEIKPEVKKEKTDTTKVPSPPAQKLSTWQKFITHLKTDRKLQIMLMVCAGLLLMASAIVAAVLLQPRPKKQTPIIAKTDTTAPNNANDEPTPTTLPRHLDGLLVAAADANNTPACVMIENAAFSGVRPQAGLSAAQVIYEVIVEGGITRLMAVYAGEAADTVGPVRSARDTYLEFASELNCAYVHAGGSYTAMLALQNFNMRFLDGLREPKWFWRDSSKYSPHNLFTSTANLYEAMSTGHSWTDDPTFAVWNFIDDEVISKDKTTEIEIDAADTTASKTNTTAPQTEDTPATPTPATDAATEVNIYFGGSYDVRYTYNEEGGYYERYNGSVPHTDENTGKTLAARNIIVQTVPPGEAIEGKGRVNFSVTGEGEVTIFRLGKVIKGKWKKADRLSRTQFFTEQGEAVPLARGTIWVEIVPIDKTFDWK